MTSPAHISSEGSAEMVKLDTRLPAIVFADANTSERFWEFFAANIRNRNPRRAYLQGGVQFFGLVRRTRPFDLANVKPIHVAAYVGERQRTRSRRIGILRGDGCLNLKTYRFLNDPI